MRRVALAGLLVLLLAPQAAAQESPVVGRNETIGGRSLTQWTVAYDRWVLGFTETELTTDAGCLAAPTGGPVRFLGVSGPQDDHVLTANCTVPAGSYLLLAQPQVFCSDVTPLPRRWRGARGLERCASENWPKVADPHPRLVLDGQPIATGPVVRPRRFRVAVPPDDNVFASPGVRRANAAVVARPTLIRPLTPGTHTLIQGIHYRVTHNMVAVYNLTVV
jgi:hypothetical protein